MKYIDEYRDKNLIKEAVRRIKAITPTQELNIMEVCGTHTQSFCRFGLDKLLPQNLHFISGPGCPVCVSSQEYIDNALKLAREKNNIILTFGDLLRVPGSRSTLEEERAKGANVHILYSSLDSLKIAIGNPSKKIIFLAVGFETTAPTIALSILAARTQKIKNLSFFAALKLIPPAMKDIIKDKRVRLSGFLCPGHVSSIIGTKPYDFIPQKYKIPCCVAGFEPLDILEGIYIILKQIISQRPMVANQYLRVVRKAGNPKAQKVIRELFGVYDANWRGFGRIPNSGLKIRDKFAEFDTNKIFYIKSATSNQRPATKCRCADILKGLIRPTECPLFAKVCIPDNPVGPCMVSNEGACNAYYKYR